MCEREKQTSRADSNLKTMNYEVRKCNCKSKKD